MTTKFEYLLNAMENAAAQDRPADHHYAKKRRAVLEYVMDLELRVGGFPNLSQKNEMNKPNEFDLPHSESKHNPLWCGGDANGTCWSDDPCWSCISWLHEYVLANRVPLENRTHVL